MQTFVSRRPSGEAVVAVEGSFEAADADLLRSMASSLALGLVTFDFHRASHVSDVAISKLAHVLLEMPSHVAVVGHSAHQRRLLRYISAGIPADRIH
jgi:hypothetical protein